MRVSPAMDRAAAKLLFEASRSFVQGARNAATAPIEDRLTKSLGKAFAAQGAHFLRVLPANGGLGTWVDSFNESAGVYHDDFVVPVRTGLATSMITGASLTMVGVGQIDESFDLANPRAKWWLQHHSAELVKGMHKESKQRLRSIITTGRVEGKAYQAIAHDLRNEFKDMSAKRARVIAVTETAFGYEQGGRMAVDQLESVGLKVTKSFLAEGNACPLCEENARAGWIPLSHEYPNGDAPAHPSCRCTSLYQTGQPGQTKVPEASPAVPGVQTKADQARELLRQGMSRSEVAKRLNMAYSQVHTLHKEVVLGTKTPARAKVATPPTPPKPKGEFKLANSFGEWQTRMKGMMAKRAGIPKDAEQLMSLRRANEMLRAFEKVSERFPDALKSIRSFDIGVYPGGNASAWAWVTPGSGGGAYIKVGERMVRKNTLSVSKKWLADEFGFDQSMRFSAASGWHHGKGNFEEVIIHELGHVVDNFYGKGTYESMYKVNEVIPADATQLDYQGRLMKQTTSSHPPSEYAVTGYGKENWRENFAEAFTEMYVLPPSQWHKITKLVDEVLAGV